MPGRCFRHIKQATEYIFNNQKTTEKDHRGDMQFALLNQNYSNATPTVQVPNVHGL